MEDIKTRHNEKRYSEACLTIKDVINTHYKPGTKIKLLRRDNWELKPVYCRVVKEYPRYVLLDNGLYKVCVNKWDLIQGFEDGD